MSEVIEVKKPSIEETRGKILALEAAMLAMPEHQLKLEPVHHFGPGVYMRELFLPKGTTATGKIHKTEHLSIISQGELSIWTEDGIKRLKASTVIKSLPGTKRVAYAHEDSVFITVHQNPEQIENIEKLEELLVTDTFEQFLEIEKQKKQLEGGE